MKSPERTILLSPARSSNDAERPTHSPARCRRVKKDVDYEIYYEPCFTGVFIYYTTQKYLEIFLLCLCIYEEFQGARIMSEV